MWVGGEPPHPIAQMLSVQTTVKRSFQGLLFSGALPIKAEQRDIIGGSIAQPARAEYYESHQPYLDFHFV